jgi:PHD/YefM family antitoxin component YafN of YafNO toxin-antitoxin module
LLPSTHIADRVVTIGLKNGQIFYLLPFPDLTGAPVNCILEFCTEFGGHMVATVNTQSLTAFRAKVAETLDRVNQTGEAEIITVNGEARGVLLAPAVFDEMAREAHAASMRRAIKQLDAGEGQELRAAMDEIRAELLAMKAAQGNRPAK